MNGLPRHYIVDSTSDQPRELIPERDLPRLIFHETKSGWRCELPPALTAFGTGDNLKQAALDLAFVLEQQAQAIRDWIAQQEVEDEPPTPAE